MYNDELNLHPKLYGVGPEIIKQILLRGLQLYFSEITNNTEFLWDRDFNKTKVFITDNMAEIEVANKKPSIIIIFGGGRWQDVWKDNFVQNAFIGEGPNKEVPIDPLTKHKKPSKVYTNILVGNINIICKARGSKSVLLANSVFLFLTVYAHELRNMGGFDISNISIGPEVLSEGDVEVVTSECGISFQFSLQQTWAIRDDKIKKMIKKVKLILNDFEEKESNNTKPLEINVCNTSVVDDC